MELVLPIKHILSVCIEKPASISFNKVLTHGRPLITSMTSVITIGCDPRKIWITSLSHILIYFPIVFERGSEYREKTSFFKREIWTAQPKAWKLQIIRQMNHPYQLIPLSDCINSWPSNAICQHRSVTESILVKVMACCMTAPSQYLNQCWPIIKWIQWHSPESDFMAQDID